MPRATFGQMHCSLARALDVIGDPWTPLVLRDIYLGLHRFEDLAVDLGIARNLLTARLRHLVETGVVERRPYSDHPPRVEYVLTEAGEDLVPVLIALTSWGDRWVGPETGPPVIFQHRCGAPLDPQVTCPECGGAVAHDTVTARAGPGGKTAPGTTLVGRVLGEPTDRLHP